MPPRSEPMTGMPLIIASMTTSGWFSHQSDGTSAIFVTFQNRRGSVVWGMIWIFPAAARSSPQAPRCCFVPRLSTTSSGISGRRRPSSWAMRANA